jgi:hypothetical protein
LYSAEFMRHCGEHLRLLDSDPPDMNLFPVGFMHMASTSDDAEKMRENWKMQM